jgi:hypothetical protein
MHDALNDGIRLLTGVEDTDTQLMLLHVRRREIELDFSKHIKGKKRDKVTGLVGNISASFLATWSVTSHD